MNTLTALVKQIDNYAVTEMQQGRTRRWVLAWSLQPHRLKQVKKPPSCLHARIITYVHSCLLSLLLKLAILHLFAFCRRPTCSSTVFLQIVAQRTICLLYCICLKTMVSKCYNGLLERLPLPHKATVGPGQRGGGASEKGRLLLETRGKAGWRAELKFSHLRSILFYILLGRLGPTEVSSSLYGTTFCVTSTEHLHNHHQPQAFAFPLPLALPFFSDPSLPMVEEANCSCTLA